MTNCLPNEFEKVKYSVYLNQFVMNILEEQGLSGLQYERRRKDLLHYLVSMF